MAAHSVTVTMTETVTYELTLTHDRLDDVLDPKHSDAGRDLSNRHLAERAEREQHALDKSS